MIGARALGIDACGLVASPSVAHGQTPAHYRDFQLGSGIASVAALTGVAASEAKTIYSRPAILKELQWRQPTAPSGETVADPVQQIAFSFYNDQLFRLVIDYDPDRTEGMTDADMVEAISTMYRTMVTRSWKATGAPLVIDEESGTRVAGWGNYDYAAVLSRSSYTSRFRMVVTSLRLNTLACAAEAKALRDARDAPQRERARQQKEADDARTWKEKARLANKAAFKP